MSLGIALPKFRRSDRTGDAAARGFDLEDDKATMRKRRVIRIAVIVFVALAAGQFMQSTRNAGGANAAGTKSGSPLSLNLGAAEAPRALLVPVTLVANASAPVVSAGVSGQAEAGIIRVLATPEDMIRLPQMPVQAAAPGCNRVLGLTAAPGAMLDVALSAACHASERVVLRHAGLAVTGKTDAAGVLLVSLPALDDAGAVTVEFADGTEVRAAAAVPDLRGLRRFGVQWAAGDAFALHGLEDGAELLAAGDVSAEAPGAAPGALPDGAALPEGGRMASVGDASVGAPLLAQVYTYPADGGVRTDMAILAAVGPDTCGRDMMGQTLASEAGAVSVTDLTLSMPPCDGQSGYLVLNNLFTDMKIVASN